MGRKPLAAIVLVEILNPKDCLSRRNTQTSKFDKKEIRRLFSEGKLK
jgi:hypothetical protein